MQQDKKMKDVRCRSFVCPARVPSSSDSDQDQDERQGRHNERGDCTNAVDFLTEHKTPTFYAATAINQPKVPKVTSAPSVISGSPTDFTMRHTSPYWHFSPVRRDAAIR